MKTLLTITFILVAGIVLLAAYNAYNVPEPMITEVSVLRDITETYLSQPKVEEILALYGLDTDPWTGGRFRYQEITDVDYNNVKQANIETAGMWLSNQFDREKEIKKFRGEIEKILSEAQNDSVGKNNTSAYLPIATELNHLSKTKMERKILIIYSDLMENNFNFSFYGKGTLDSLRNHSDAMLKLFETRMPLENLDGVTVYLIYQSLNNKDSERFRIVSEFYRSMLESKGAEVHIGANLVL